MELADLGHIIEGVVELDPMDDTPRIRTIDDSGKQILINPVDLLRGFAGKDVKMTLTSLENLQKIQELLEQTGGMVQAVMPEDLDGVSVTTTRKPND